MKELSFNEVKEVSGAAFQFDGCSWLSPVDAIGFGVSLGGGYGAAFGAGGAAAGTATAMSAGGAVGAAAGFSGFVGYNIGVGFNRLFGVCD